LRPACVLPGMVCPKRFPGWQAWYAPANLVRDQIEWVRVLINAIKKIDTKVLSKYISVGRSI